MKILQLNIWHGKLMWAITNLINKYRPDIVCMQEVQSLKGKSGAMFFSVEEISKLTNLNNSFFSGTHSYRYMNRTAEFGNAIISNQEFINKYSKFTYGNFIENGDCVTDELLSRLFQHTTIEFSNEQLNIINYHGYFDPAGKQGSPLATSHLEQISRYIEDLTGPVVLCGDFNLAPTSPSLKPFSYLDNQSVIAKLQCTYQSPALSNQTDVCDYILTRGVKVKSFKMLNEIASDHKALLIEI